MNVQPASIEQVRRAADGRLVTISADAGGVATSIRRLDPCLRLRYSERGECWIVYRVHRNGEPCRDDDPERTEELVLTARECDQRIVKRLEEIDPHGRSGYDFAKEVERQNREAAERRRKEFSERVGPYGELAAHAVRKDLGEKYRGRIFKPREIT